MKPFQNSNIILNIVVFRTAELYLKNIIPSDPQQQKRPYKASLSTEVYMLSLSSVQVPRALVW